MDRKRKPEEGIIGCRRVVDKWKLNTLVVCLEIYPVIILLVIILFNFEVAAMELVLQSEHYPLHEVNLVKAFI